MFTAIAYTLMDANKHLSFKYLFCRPSTHITPCQSFCHIFCTPYLFFHVMFNIPSDTSSPCEPVASLTFLNRVYDTDSAHVCPFLSSSDGIKLHVLMSYSCPSIFRKIFLFHSISSMIISEHFSFALVTTAFTNSSSH